MYLKCPSCGFEFGVFFADGITEEEKIELKRCPCGTMCEEIEFFGRGKSEPRNKKEEA